MNIVDFAELMFTFFSRNIFLVSMKTGDEMTKSIESLVLLCALGLTACESLGPVDGDDEAEIGTTVINQDVGPARDVQPDNVERVSPETVYNRVLQGNALLVCAYENSAALWAAELEAAISAKEFRDRLPDLSKSQEVYFYCA